MHQTTGGYMRFFIAFTLLLAASNIHASLEDNAPSKSQVFSLTPEEMVFASKLSDENRHKFCYAFSLQERVLALQESKEISPNESVEKVIATAPQPHPNLVKQ
jgi:hypothetical protein